MNHRISLKIELAIIPVFFAALLFLSPNAFAQTIQTQGLSAPTGFNTPALGTTATGPTEQISPGGNAASVGAPMNMSLTPGSAGIAPLGVLSDPNSAISSSSTNMISGSNPSRLSTTGTIGTITNGASSPQSTNPLVTTPQSGVGTLPSIGTLPSLAPGQTGTTSGSSSAP